MYIYIYVLHTKLQHNRSAPQAWSAPQASHLSWPFDMNSPCHSKFRRCRWSQVAHHSACDTRPEWALRFLEDASNCWSDRWCPGSFGYLHTHIYNYIYISWLISSLTGFYGRLWQIYRLVRVRYCINQLMCGQSDSAPSGNPWNVDWLWLIGTLQAGCLMT